MRELEESEEKYPTWFEGFKDAFYMTTVEGKFIDLNQATVELFGYESKKELMKIESTAQLYFNPEDRRKMQEIMSRQGYVKDMEQELRRKDGTKIYALVTGNTRRDDRGKVIGYEGTIKDITERKRVEEALRESEERYRSLVENIDLGVNLIDSDHNIVMVSAVLSRKYKKPINEIIGKKCYRELEKRDAVCPHCPGVRAMATGQPAEFESEGVINNSHRFNARIKAFPTFAKDGTVTGFIEVVEDITESKKAADALRESERRFRRLVEHSTDAFFLHDFDGSIIDVNQHSCESLGYTREELLGLSMQDIDQEVISGKHLERWKQMVPGKPITLEGVHQRKDGMRFPVETRLGIFEAGERRLILGLVRDITERKRAEEALRQTEERYRTILESIEDGYYEVDLAGNHTFFNDSLCSMYGYTRDELMGMNNRDYMSPETSKETFRIFNKVYTTGKPIKVFDHEGIKKDGSTIYVEISISLMRDAKGEPVGFRGIVRDITERKQMEEELRRSEERFKTLVTHAPLGMNIIAKDGRYEYLNPKFTEIFGYTLKDVPTGKKWLEKAHPDPNYRQKVVVGWKEDLRSGKLGETPPRVFTVTCKDGSKKEILFRPAALIDERQLVMYEDITERKQMEDKLREYSERLEEMVEQRTKDLREAQEQLVRQEKLAVMGQLAGGIGHELRNPLGAIKNAAYFLNMVLEKPDPKVKETLEIMEKEVATSEKIIGSLLDFARPKPPTRRKVDINDVVREALSRTMVPENIEVVTQLHEGRGTILADPDQLVQVFGNIILNSIQAMPEGGQLIVKSEIATPKWSAVSFSDTGVGIPEGTLERLFEPLFSTKTKGIGLGLAIVKTLVEGHRGTIKVQSEVAKGSTFTVRLPFGGGEEKEHAGEGQHSDRR